MPQYRAEKRGQSFNWPALIVWAGTLLLCFFMPFHLFFRWLPGYFIALVSYTLMNMGHRNEERRASKGGAG